MSFNDNFCSGLGSDQTTSSGIFFVCCKQQNWFLGCFDLCNCFERLDYASFLNKISLHQFWSAVYLLHITEIIYLLKTFSLKWIVFFVKGWISSYPVVCSLTQICKWDNVDKLFYNTCQTVAVAEAKKHLTYTWTPTTVNRPPHVDHKNAAHVPFVTLVFRDTH